MDTSSGHKLTVAPHAINQVALSLTSENAQARKVTLDAAAVGLLVKDLLVAINLAEDKSQPLVDRTKTKKEYPVVHPTQIGMAPSHRKTHICLMLFFGETELGIELPREALEYLGKAFLGFAVQGLAN